MAAFILRIFTRSVRLHASVIHILIHHLFWDPWVLVFVNLNDYQ